MATSATVPSKKRVAAIDPVKDEDPVSYDNETYNFIKDSVSLRNCKNVVEKQRMFTGICQERDKTLTAVNKTGDLRNEFYVEYVSNLQRFDQYF